MSNLTELALAGFQLEKNAGRYDSPGALKEISKDLVGALKKHTPTAIAAGVGARVATKKPVEKKASLVDVAKGIASVGKNIVKQNPLAAKAALGGAVAGAAATKALQTKQAEEKKPYGILRHARDAALTGIDAYAGKAAGGMIAAATSPHQIGGHLHTGRIGFGKGLGMAAGAAIGVANSIGRREAHQKYASSESVEKKPEAKPGQEGTKAQSSLIASAKAEMAKAASKK